MHTFDQMRPMQIHWPDGLNPEVFVRDYWQQKPLLIRQAVPDFENPLSPDELGGLAMDPEIASRLILRESDQRWHLSHGPFTEQQLTELPTSDWSLLVSDIDRHLDGFHVYLEPFRFIPDWRIDDLMISYAPTGASVGPHRDNYDVFLLQAAGIRLWQIGPVEGYSTDCLPNHDLSILSSFEPDRQHLCEPGDLLYLPPGVPHHGISQDNDCMTWSIGFRAPSERSLVSGICSLLENRLSDVPTFKDHELAPEAPAGLLTTTAIDQLQQIWSRATTLSRSQFTEYVGSVLTQSTLPEHDLAAADADSDISGLREIQLEEHDYLDRHPLARLAFADIHGQTMLFANGQAVAVTRSLAEYLCSEHRYRSDSLAGFARRSEADRRAISRLAGLDLFEPGQPE